MNKNLEHYVLHKNNFLEESFCEKTIKELEDNNGWAKHGWITSDGQTYQASGDNEPEIVNLENFSSTLNETNNLIVEKLRSTILEYINSLKFEWFDRWSGYSEMKFIRYSEHQTMSNHCDHIHSLFDGKRRGIPTLSIIGILNDDYEGGELIMFEDKKIHTKAGDLLIFPSNFLYPHEITPVSKGVRYSYVSWVW